MVSPHFHRRAAYEGSEGPAPLSSTIVIFDIRIVVGRYCGVHLRNRIISCHLAMPQAPTDAQVIPFGLAKKRPFVHYSGVSGARARRQARARQRARARLFLEVNLMRINALRYHALFLPPEG